MARPTTEHWHAAEAIADGLKALLVQPGIDDPQREALRTLWKQAVHLRQTLA